MSRRVTLVLGGFVLLLFILASPPWPGGNGWQMLAVTTAWLGVCVAAYWLADKRLLAAHVLLVGGAAILLALAVWANRPAAAGDALHRAADAGRGADRLARRPAGPGLHRGDP